MRQAQITRKTLETEVNIEVQLEGKGIIDIDCPLKFFQHMLHAFSQHSQIDISAKLHGDIDVDPHHLVEDTAIVLGAALKKALGSKKGISRAGFFYYPMDEALAFACIDLSNRPYLMIDYQPNQPQTGDFPNDLVEDFFQSLCCSLGATIHLKIISGRSDHHKIEALFKAFARALKNAIAIDENQSNIIPSTKGVL